LARARCYATWEIALQSIGKRRKNKNQISKGEKRREEVNAKKHKEDEGMKTLQET